MEAFITVKLCIGFLYTPAKYLTNKSAPKRIPGAIISYFAYSQQAKSMPRSEDTIYFSSLHFSLEKTLRCQMD